jgi:CheY-like chemotaxis protein
MRGRGSTFVAIIPRDGGPVTPTAPRPPSPALAPPPGVALILVVDDDARERAWLARVLTGAGYAVVTAASGVEAIAAARARPVDAVTLDLVLPDMSGWQVLAALRRERPEVPVIAVTVVADRQAAAAFPLAEYLVKPVQGPDLVTALRRAGVSPDGRPTVLVVDDDAPTRRLVEASLTPLGYRVVAAIDGAAGLEAAAAVAPAAIVLDLMMPALDGFEFLARYRTTPASRGVPVIVWSAKQLTAADRTRLGEAATRVIPKGDGATVLLGTLDAVLRGAR